MLNIILSRYPLYATSVPFSELIVYPHLCPWDCVPVTRVAKRAALHNQYIGQGSFLNFVLFASPEFFTSMYNCGGFCMFYIRRVL